MRILTALKSALFTLSLAISPIATQAKSEPAQVNLLPTREQASTVTQIMARLSQSHYVRKPIDDRFSQQLLAKYLETLDPSKNVFLQSDISEFTKYESSLDDHLKAGQLGSGFDIFNRYRNRSIDRLKLELKELDQRVKKLDFSQDESMDVERKDDNWPRDAHEADEQWRKKLKAQVLSLRLTGKEESKIIELIQKRYRNQLDVLLELKDEDAFQLYMNSVTALYDPHTNYLSPVTSENFNINMSLKLEGIGAVLQKDDEYTKVVRLVPAGPADKQGGLKAADRIVGVGEGNDGEMTDVVGWRLDDVVQRIRGAKDTIVRLQVLPAGATSDSEIKEIAIKRDTVKLEEQAAQKKIITIKDGNDIEHKIGVIDVPAFYVDFEALRQGDPNYRSTTRDVAILLNDLLQQKVSGIIIDLRDNGGGSLREANDLTGLFIDYGPTVQIRDSSNHVASEQKLPNQGYYTGPLVVLINRLSASASEIFAGALQDYGRAIVVGGQSFGKGTVQSLVNLRQGQLKLTESKFYRISGESTQHRGVVPDIPFPDLYDPNLVGESALDGALPWDKISAAYYRGYYDFTGIKAELQAKHQNRVKNDPDFRYIEKQIALNASIKDEDEVSLNEAKRKQEDAEQKSAMLALVNERRLAKGQSKLNSLEELEKEQSAKDEKLRAEEEEAVYLNEAGRILVDSLGFFRQRVADNRSRTTWR